MNSLSTEENREALSFSSLPTSGLIFVFFLGYCRLDSTRPLHTGSIDDVFLSSYVTSHGH